jgi:hypothetical protein
VPPWDELEKELGRPGLTVTVVGDDNGATIRWERDNQTAASASLVLRPEGVEWTEFYVREGALDSEDFRRRGIFTQALKLQHGWFKTHGLGRSLIRKNAANAGFYRDVAFVDAPGDGPFMVQDGRRSRSWLKGRA